MAASRIELPEQLDAYVQFKIASGLYSNGAEVIRDALRRMMEADEEASKAMRLQRALAVGFAGIEQEEGEEYTPAMLEQLRAQAREAVDRGQNPQSEVTA